MSESNNRLSQLSVQTYSSFNYYPVRKNREMSNNILELEGEITIGKGKVSKYLTTKETSWEEVAETLYGKGKGELLGEALKRYNEITKHMTQDMVIFEGEEIFIPKNESELYKYITGDDLEIYRLLEKFKKEKNNDLHDMIMSNVDVVIKLVEKKGEMKEVMRLFQENGININEEELRKGIADGIENYCREKILYTLGNLHEWLKKLANDSPQEIDNFLNGVKRLSKEKQESLLLAFTGRTEVDEEIKEVLEGISKGNYNKGRVLIENEAKEKLNILEAVIGSIRTIHRYNLANMIKDFPQIVEGSLFELGIPKNKRDTISRIFDIVEKRVEIPDSFNFIIRDPILRVIRERVAEYSNQLEQEDKIKKGIIKVAGLIGGELGSIFAETFDNYVKYAEEERIITSNNLILLKEKRLDKAQDGVQNLKETQRQFMLDLMEQGVEGIASTVTNATINKVITNNTDISEFRKKVYKIALEKSTAVGEKLLTKVLIKEKKN